MAKETQLKMPLIDITYVDVNKAKTREKTFETVDPASETEQAGYISPQKQIENMILAGQRLDQSRLMYDFDSEDDIDEDATDPTRNPNYDLADASQAQIALQASVKPPQTAQEPSGAVKTDTEGGNVPPPPQGA